MRPPPAGPEPAASGSDGAAESTPGGGSGWWAFRAGLGEALRRWAIVLVFYAALVLLAGLLLLPFVQGLTDWIGHRLAAGDLAGGIPGWLLVEMGFQPPGFLGPALLVALFMLPAWPFLMALPFVLLSGGALAVYAQGSRNSLGKRFWQGVARYALPLALLLLLEVVALEVVLGLAVLVTLALALTGTIWAPLLPLPIVVAVLMALLWWFEYARVEAVVGPERRVFRALGRSAVFLRHNLGPAAGLALFNFLLGLLPYLPYYLLAWLLPAAWWGGQALLQQLLVLALVGTRLARMAGQVRLVQAHRGAPQSPPGWRDKSSWPSLVAHDRPYRLGKASRRGRSGGRGRQVAATDAVVLCALGALCALAGATQAAAPGGNQPAAYAPTCRAIPRRWPLELWRFLWYTVACQ